MLKIPDTPDWEPSLTFTIAGGAIVLGYKLILVLPLTQLIAGLLTRTFGEEAEEEEVPVPEVAPVG